jgi:hypothetical protein
MNKRKIKTISANRETYTVLSALDKELTLVKHPAFLREFDEKGKLISESNFDFEGQITEKYVYKYENDLLVEKVTFYDETEEAEKEFHAYAQGLRTKTTIQYNEGYEETFIYEYDQKGRLLSRKSEEEFGEKDLYEYLNNNIILKQFDEDGNNYSTIRSTLDTKGRVISKTVSDENGENQTDYVYDEFDRIGEEIEINLSDSSTKKNIIDYDSDGKPLKITSINDDEITITKYSYDSLGNEILQEETDENDNLYHKVQRKFDEEGNVLETHVEIIDTNSIDRNYSLYYHYQFFE